MSHGTSTSPSDATGPLPAVSPDRLFDRGPAARLTQRHAELADLAEVSFGGVDLIIPRGVFCPTLTNTSRLLLDAIDFPSHGSLLDVFCGSGAFGIIAAIRGAEDVVSIDADPRAVIATRLNAVRNNVSTRLEAVTEHVGQSTMNGRTFDVIIANPPLLPGEPQGLVGRALYDPGLASTAEFIRLTSKCLSRNGCAYLITSSVAGRINFDVALVAGFYNLASDTCRVLDAGYETYRVDILTHDRNRL